MIAGYKGVRKYVGEDIVDKMGRTITEGDLVDIYTGNSFRNNIGDSNGMKRRQVCDDHTVWVAQSRSACRYVRVRH